MAANSATADDNLLLHILILIPIEFGILHSTILGPMLTEGFASLWNSVGLESIVHTHEAGSHAHAFANAATPGTDALAPACHYHLDGNLYCDSHEAPTVEW